MEYIDFLKSKEEKVVNNGFKVSREDLNNNLFEYQKDIVLWALAKGKAAVFTQCGTGKTIIQLEWANQVNKHTDGKILILTPLAVAKQTQNEGAKFGINTTICRCQEDVNSGINIANYDILHKFNLNEFVGIVLDESSCLKDFTSKTKIEIIEGFKNTKYKLACSATPSPNDHMELGNHSEFLNVMSRTEMLAMYFVHDGGSTSEWRLKGHAVNKFWKWVSEWAVMIDNPNDLGYKDKIFELPKLNIKEVIVKTKDNGNELIPHVALTLNERREARKESIEERLEAVKDLVYGTEEQWLIWCDYNYEADALREVLPNSVEVRGSDTSEFKEENLLAFAEGKIERLITKPSIASMGLNYQSCNNMIFFGLSDSYEKFYQAIKRCHRFGQTKEVNVYVVIGEKEIAVLNNIKKKQEDAETMKREMIKYANNIKNLESASKIKKVKTYDDKLKVEMTLPSWM